MLLQRFSTESQQRRPLIGHLSGLCNDPLGQRTFHTSKQGSSKVLHGHRSVVFYRRHIWKCIDILPQCLQFPLFLNLTTSRSKYRKPVLRLPLLYLFVFWWVLFLLSQISFSPLDQILSPVLLLQINDLLGLGLLFSETGLLF